MKKKNILRNNKGFTLTELMIVIVIIGVLASIAIPKFRSVTTRAKAVEFKPILAHIYALQESHYSESDSYTSDLGQLGFDDPKAKFFTFSVEADSTTFTAIATCTADLKGENNESLRGMKVTLDQDEEHGGDLPLRRAAKW
ncbi:MAG: prepilin-type N-terminal cleavage/methylation domain-containing protein [Fibrobacteres bacterium]|nr:prepilin-type N-terminal cleavage/methylation domain-containing protein [Fibrobacterota bacterium]